jgi:hypothetical protein
MRTPGCPLHPSKNLYLSKQILCGFEPFFKRGIFETPKHSRSVLLVEETGVPGENHRPATSHGQTLSHNVVSNIACKKRNSNPQL